MADSKRLAVMKALTAFLAAEVTPANGYQHDLSVSRAVVRGKRSISSKDHPMPCVSIIEDLDPDRVPDAAGYNQRAHKFKLFALIQGWCEDDKDAPTDPAYNLMADVFKAMWKLLDDTDPNYLLPVMVAGNPVQLIDGIGIEAGTVRPPDQASELAYFWRKCSLEITERTAEPYRLD